MAQANGNDEVERSTTDDEDCSDDIDILVTDQKSSKIIKRTRPRSNIIHQWYMVVKRNSKCKTCSKVLQGTNATNLINHLKKRHGTEYGKYVAGQSISKDNNNNIALSTAPKRKKLGLSNYSIESSFQQQMECKNGLAKGSDGYLKAFRAISMSWAANSLAYRLIEDPFIKQMFTIVSNGRLQTLPTCHELSEKVSKVSKELKESIGSSIKSAKFVAITMDLWSRLGYSSSMIGATCDYFDRNSNKIRRALLACRTLKHPHTGKNIFDIYNVVISEWNINENKVLRIITDNGSNVVSAFKDSIITLVDVENTNDLSSEATSTVDGRFAATSSLMDVAPNLDETFEEPVDDEESIEFERNESDMEAHFYRQKRLSCFAHHLMLAVKKAVENSVQLNQAKKKADSLISTLSKSPKAIETLKEKTGGKGLIKPVITRWIYWYYVFNRLVDAKFKKCLLEVCEELEIIHSLCPSDWKLLELVRDLLAPFAGAITRLEGELYTTISEVYPIFDSLKEKMKEYNQSTMFHPVKSIIRSLLQELDTRFSRIYTPTNVYFDPIYLVATLLDPRYHLLLDGDLIDSAKPELKCMIAMNGTTTSSSPEAALNPVAPSRNQSSSSHSMDILAVARAKINEKRSLESLISPVGAVDQEITALMNEMKAVDPMDDPMNDPLVFWKKKQQYIQIYTMWRSMFCVSQQLLPHANAFSAELVLCFRKCDIIWLMKVWNPKYFLR